MIFNIKILFQILIKNKIFMDIFINYGLKTILKWKYLIIKKPMFLLLMVDIIVLI